MKAFGLRKKSWRYKSILASDKIAKLNLIYENGIGGGESAAFFQSCLYERDYLVRSRALALAARRSDLDCDAHLVALVFRDEEREWQLRAINALEKCGKSSAIAALKPLLWQNEKPLLLRATLWLTVAAADFAVTQALATFAHFIVSPYSGYLKASFIADTLSFALKRTPNAPLLWQQQCLADDKVGAAWRFYEKFVSAQAPLLQVYPYPDYLTKMAAKHQISAKELSQALFFKGKIVAKPRR